MTLMFTESHQNQLYALDAEGIVIATLLQSQDTIAPLAAILTPDMFYMHLHGLIFGAATKIKKLGGEVNAQTVSEELFLQKVLKGMIDDYESQVYKIVRQHLPSASVIEYATIVRDKYKSRKYRDFCIQSAGLFSDLPVDEAKEKFELGLVELSKINSSEHTVPISKPMADVFTGLMETYDRRQQGKMEEVILPTGIRDLDALIGGGIARARLIVMMGATGMGKTTLLQAILKNASYKLKRPSLLFSIEMTAEAQSEKIYSNSAQIPITALQNGAIQDQQWEKLAEARESYIDIPMMINDRVRNIEDIISISRNYYAEHGEIAIIAIDFLQLIKSTRKELFIDKRARFIHVLEELNQLKKELNTRIILLSQIGRNVKDRNEKRPTINDAAETGALEELSDLLISFYRDEYYNPDTVDRGIMEVSVLKGRSVPTGMVKVLFDGQYSTIQDLKHAY
jgi:replicative DNA helicase